MDLAKDCHFGEREGRVPALEPEETLPAWPYLDTDNAYRCPGCSKCYVKLKSVQRHFQKIHGKTTRVHFDKVKCQELFKGIGRDGVWVPVDEGEVESERGAGGEVAVIAQNLQMQLAQHLQSAFTVNWTAKDAWPYLKAVPWHTVVEANQDRYELEELRRMVSIPKLNSEGARNCFPAQLAVFVERWVLSLETEVRQADYRLKQLLGSDSGEYVAAFL
ncbi:hypothetical protein NliqN6_0915 [Naganishia liquefaciens]|uniref:C2H2-type domain-containing protein n=1 Tax=Naganishia liquefaciens TaxID=104408 RepID=A0A8H3TPE9_9TREE|nr:hypothetical protein NliqN6_0915 [Naganishia liquefaciens]